MGLCQTVGASAAFAPKQFAVIKTVQIVKEPKAYARAVVQNNREFTCLNKLWMQESRWKSEALNRSSGAYGIAQFMPTTWKNYNVKKTKDPIKQVKYGLRYIKMRYGSSCKAWSHEQRYGWY